MGHYLYNARGEDVMMMLNYIATILIIYTALCLLLSYRRISPYRLILCYKSYDCLSDY